MELLCLFQTKTLLRYSDIQRIRWLDVLDKDCLILNEKKTQKRRNITLSQSLKNDIRKTYNQLQPPMDGFIFKYSLQHTNVLLKEGGKDCKIRNKNISTHSFRKSGGRYVYETFGCSDDSLIKLSLLLNHSTTSVTRRYLSIQKEEIEDIYQSFDVF
jgi:integrase